MDDELRRRDVLKGIGGLAGLTATAGCLDGEDSIEDVAQTLRERANKEIEPGERILFAHPLTHNQGEIIGHYVNEDRDIVLEAITRLDDEIENPKSYINGENQDKVFYEDRSDIFENSLSGAELHRNKFWGDAYLDSTIQYHFIDLTANYDNLDDLLVDSMDSVGEIAGFTETRTTNVDPDNEDMELLERVQQGDIQADQQLHSKYAEPHQMSIILSEENIPSAWNGEESEFRVAYPKITDNYQETLQNTLREMGYQLKLPNNFTTDGVMSKHPEAENETNFSLFSRVILQNSVSNHEAILEPVEYPNNEGYADIAIQLRTQPSGAVGGQGGHLNLDEFIECHHPEADFEPIEDLYNYELGRGDPNTAEHVSYVEDNGEYSTVIYEFGSIPGLEDELHIKMSYDIDDIEIR